MEWLILAALALAFARVRRFLLDSAAARRLASRIGFGPVKAFARGPQDWFQGVAHGRRVCIGLVSLRVSRPQWFRKSAMHLCIAVDIATRAPLGTLAYRSQLDPSSLHRFEEAFRLENGERLSSEARNALLGFVRKGYGERYSRLRNQDGPDARNLRLSDRARVPAEVLPAHVMADACTVLVHCHPRLHLSADEFGRLLSELAVVADAVEESARGTLPTERNWAHGTNLDSRN